MPLCWGYTQAEVAAQISGSDHPMGCLRATSSTMSPSRVSALMGELRDEIRRVSE